MSPMVITEVDMFQDHLLKVFMPTDGLFNESYMRVTMLGSCGQDHGSPNVRYHFCLAYGSHEEILDHHTNKLNQDPNKA